LFILLILASFGLVGIPFLAYWWLDTYGRELVVTKKRVRKRQGIVSNQTSELELGDVKNVKVEQGMIQSLTGVGTLRLSSAGQSGMEIVMHSIENPEGVRDLIYDTR